MKKHIIILCLSVLLAALIMPNLWDLHVLYFLRDVSLGILILTMLQIILYVALVGIAWIMENIIPKEVIADLCNGVCFALPFAAFAVANLQGKMEHPDAELHVVRMIVGSICLYAFRYNFRAIIDHLDKQNGQAPVVARD